MKREAPKVIWQVSDQWDRSIRAIWLVSNLSSHFWRPRLHLGSFLGTRSGSTRQSFLTGCWRNPSERWKFRFLQKHLPRHDSRFSCWRQRTSLRGGGRCSRRDRCTPPPPPGSSPLPTVNTHMRYRHCLMRWIVFMQTWIDRSEPE